jgi:hypothetical protein
LLTNLQIFQNKLLRSRINSMAAHPGAIPQFRLHALASPDDTIKMTFADYTARRDPVFERAVALAAD